jgi:hypothetical protein
MSSPEEKLKHSRRIRAKKKERVRSVIAKDLIVSSKYNPRIVKDKRGKKHDLDKMKFIDLVEAIQEDE